MVKFFAMLAALPPVVSACMCVTPVLCSSQPDPARIAFVGRVIDSYPASVFAYGLPGEDDFHMGDAPGSFALHKQILLSLWQSAFTPAERAAVEMASDSGTLRAATDLHGVPRRVRFEVSAWLSGSGRSTSEVFTSFDSCGFKFEPGKQYLVLSRANDLSGRWETGACSGNALAATKQARQDIAVLRAWKPNRKISPCKSRWRF